MKNVLKIVLVALLFFTATFTAKALGYEADGGQALAAATVVNLPLLNQQAEKEMIKKFRHDNTWLSELKSKNGWVNNEVIKIPRQGADPTVLINNTVYPVAKAQRADTHLVVSLNKYDTENTIVTADELYALPYEKVSDVQEQHRTTLEDKTAQHALHSISPQENTATMPVLQTTGADDGTGRLKLTSKDIVRLKKALDKLNVPKENRVLVLCPDHVADLLDEDRTFYMQYQNAKDGVLSTRYYGFKTYEANYTPTYTALNQKVAFDAVAGPKVSSICFHKNYAIKATGTVQRFAKSAADNPEMRENVMGFRQYFVAVGIKDEGFGAIIG
jgi:hypothetical protein